MKRITITLVLLLAAFLCFTCKARSGSSGTQSGAVVLGYPIVTDGSVTLRYWVPIQVSASRFIQSYAENPAYQEMEKRTGVKIEFNLLMASGDLPDLMTSGNLYRGGEFQGLYDGIFLDLTDLVPRYAPEYMKLIRDDEEFFREVSDDDGKLVAFFAYKPYGDPPFTRVILRKDILAEVGRDIPRLISDYDSLFAAMLAKDIVPFLPPNNGLIKQFVGAYGIIPGLHKNASGRIQYGQVLPEFRQYLEMMNRWYAAGYISKDFTSVTTPQGNTLFDTKKIGMQIGAIVANFNRGATLGFEVTSAPYPRLRAGDQLHHEDTNIWPLQGKGTQMAVISAKTAHPEITARWLNYGYTADGIELMNWGVEGLNYTKINGENVYNDLMLKNPRFGTEEASYIYKMHFAPKVALFDVVAHANLLASPASLASRMMWADDPNVDSSLNIPDYQRNQTEQNLRTRVLTEINTYVDEMVLKFITGSEPLSRWDTYVSTINGMGLADVLRSEQGAYDRYTAKKLK